MKRSSHRLAFTLTTLVLATAAQAVPIHFNFTGAVFYETGPNAVGLLNQAVSGRFAFETDALVFQPRDDGAWIETHVDVGPSRSTSHLTIGSREFTLPVMGDRMNGISFFDGCRPAPISCLQGAGESFSVFAYSGDLPVDTTSATGTFHVAQVQLFSSVPFITNPSDPTGPQVPAFDYIDLLAGMEPEAIIDLPLLELQGGYNEFVFTCVEGVCGADTTLTAVFSIDTVERGFDSVSVPEPGTLGLFGWGIGVAFVLRRRRVTAQ